MTRKRTEEVAPIINEALEVYETNVIYLGQIVDDQKKKADIDAALTAFSVAQQSLRDLKEIDRKCREIGLVPDYDIEELVESHRKYADELQRMIGQR
jgi:hypothetical protein